MDIILPHFTDYCKLSVYVSFGPGPPNDPKFDENCSKILDRLKSIKELTVIETENPPRRILPHFFTDLIESRTIWGDFQMYRKILGFIFIGFLNQNSEKLLDELEFLLKQYSNFKNKRKNSLVDSRCCLIFDFPASEHKKLALSQDFPIDSNEILKYYGKIDEKFDENDRKLDQNDEKLDKNHQEMNKNYQKFDKNDQTMNKNGLTTILDQLESDIKDYLKNLFWVLEGKRLNLGGSFEQLDNLACPMAPDEEKFLVGIDTSNRTFRKRRLGRLKKQWADSTLLTGLPIQAVDIYLTSIDILKSANDFLWLAGAYEGYSAACMILKYYYTKNLHINNDLSSQEPGLRRVSTFTLGQGQQNNPQNNRLNKNKSLTDNIDLISAVNLMAKNGGLSPKHSFSSKINTNPQNAINRLKIEASDIEEKARFALENYRKFSIAVAIECECVMKTAFLFIEEKRFMALDAFLRENCCFRFLSEDFKNFTDVQKADICLIIGNLYKKVNFERKCSYYLRLSALFRFNIANLNEKNESLEVYRKIYPVLLSSMNSYLLSYRRSKFLSIDNFGWPAVCIRAFHELYVIAQRSQYTEAAKRHLAHFIHTTLEFLNEQILEQLCNELKTACRENLHNASIPLKVTRNITLPPLSLIKFPKVLDFTVCSLPAYLIPKETDIDESSKIFIYTPLIQTNLHKKLLWVVNCAGIVEIRVENLLPVEIEVKKLMVHCQGVEYDANPTLLVLPPHHEITAKLIVIPKSAGILTITGYTCEVMNIRTECRVDDITWLKRKRQKSIKHFGQSDFSSFGPTNQIKVDVIEALPELGVSTSLSRAQNLLPFDSTEVCSAEIQLFSGQKSYQTVQILNKSGLPVHHLSHEIQQPSVSGGSNLVEICQQNSEIDEISDFSNQNLNHIQQNLSESGDFPSILPSKTSFSFKICINSVDPLDVFDDPSKNEDMEIYDKQEIIKSIPYTGRLLVANLKFHYIGGDSSVKYQRTCSLTINVTIVPVIVIVDWNLLPGESATNRYLALDIINACESEIDVEFAENKVAVVQPKDICRIPVLCECCTYDEKNTDLHNFPSIRGPYFKQMLLSLRRKLLQKHLLTQLAIRWKLGSENGLVPLGYLIKSLSLRDDLFISPLSAVVDINNNGQNSATDFNCTVGFVNTMKIQLNFSNSSLKLNGFLNLNCYQDLQNGTILTSEQIVFLGSRDIKFHLHEELTKFGGAFQFLFLSEGLYKLELKFSPIDFSTVNDNRNLPFCFPLLPVYTFTVT